MLLQTFNARSGSLKSQYIGLSRNAVADWPPIRHGGASLANRLPLVARYVLIDT